MGPPLLEAVDDGYTVTETHGLTKRYRDVTAIEDIDLTIGAGQVFGFLGPNGAGKSTFLRVVMGLLAPTSGRVTVFGLDVADHAREIHRRVGYLPGDFAPYLSMTGTEYLGLISRIRGCVTSGGHTELADRLRLDLGRRIGELSHGNRQKVGLIQAFMHQPELIVLDEPTQGLDPLMQGVFLDLVRERREAGDTVLLSSHILSEVEVVADRVAIVRAGRLAATADVAELAARTRRRVELRFTGDDLPTPESLLAIPEVRSVTRHASAIEVIVEGSMDQLFRAVAPFGIDRVTAGEIDLESVFLQYYDGEPAGAGRGI